MRESRVPVREGFHTGPHGFGGRAKLSKDLVDLIDLRVTREERPLGNHFHEDGSDRPNIHGRGVGLRAEQDFWRAVPKGNHLVGQRTNGRAKSTRKTKVSDLESSVPCDKQVLGL